MQFLKDLISSMYKHIDTRINSPILGTLSAIFVILYWDKFTLLFWGTGTIDTRVTQFKSFLTGITTSRIFIDSISDTSIFIFITLSKLSYWVNSR